MGTAVQRACRTATACSARSVRSARVQHRGIGVAVGETIGCHPAGRHSRAAPYWNTLAQNLVAWQLDASILRLGHELNGNGYPWAALVAWTGSASTPEHMTIMMVPMIARVRSFFAFRDARRRADPEIARHLAIWAEVSRRHGFELAPGALLGDSAVHGRYQGLEARIGLAFDEVRVVTTFEMSLPGPPVAGLLEQVARSARVHERRDALLAAFAPYDTSERRRAVEPLFVTSLGLSETSIACAARYLTKATEHEAILALMASIAWAMTVTP